MENALAIQLAKQVFELAGTAEPSRQGILWNPSKYFIEAAYAARQIPAQLRPEWLLEWARTWKVLMDDFEVMRAKDPMMAYNPANEKALAFHQSRAFVRRFRGGNRTSKTQSGYAEDYFCLTGYDPYKPQAPWGSSALIITGLPFSDYVARVFEKKFLYGEDGPEGQNPLSPIFPEGGKWFYKYDKKDHIITLGCIDCARAGQASSCPGHHKKVTVALSTSEKGTKVIEAFTVRRVHIDEHVPQEFFPAAIQRVGDQQGDIILTGTPLHGPEAWEEKEITKPANRPAHANLKDPHDPKSPPYAFMVNVSKWEGGIVPHSQIRAEIQGMNVFERQARIDGIPAAMTSTPVFDHDVLEHMKKSFEREPLRGKLVIASGKDYDTIERPEHLRFIKANDDRDPVQVALRIWDFPKPYAQYILAVDTAAGLSRAANDPSCAGVFELVPNGVNFKLRLVAQWHEWMSVHDYANECFKLAIFYNAAIVVVELTGGLGRAVVERLVKELFYWNIFRDTRKGEYADFGQDPRFGIETSPQNKPSMVAITQQLIKDLRVEIPCTDTIAELVAYEQTKTDFGNARYAGASGSHDDRTMTVVIAGSVCITHNLFDAEQAAQQAIDESTKAIQEITQDGKFWQAVDRELKEEECLLP